MAVAKSPKYPNFSLRQAVTQAEKIFKADRRNAIDREVAVKHMGYSSVSGASDKAVGTMVQFGLLEYTGKSEMRVTQMTVDILHPADAQGRKIALARAASTPPLFKELKGRFPDGVSDDALRSYLMRSGFLDRAVNPIVSSFNDTQAFLKQEGAFESGGPAESEGAEVEPPKGPDDEKSKVTYGGARVGDLIQWESQGELQLEEPLRVRWVSDDGQWVAVDGSDAGIRMIEAIVHERANAGPPAIPAAALTKAQEMARTPGVGPVSGAQIANLPPAGWTQAVFPLADGPVFLNFPDQMSADGYAELKEYLDIFLRRAERSRRQQEGSSDQG